MNDQELDQLIKRFGQDYNLPPGDPPLESIRGGIQSRLEAERARTFSIRAIVGIAAAAAVAIGLATSSPAHRGGQPGLSPADVALTAAITSAELAVRQHPGDPYFAEHLTAMKENAAEFQRIAASLQGST